MRLETNNDRRQFLDLFGAANFLVHAHLRKTGMGIGKKMTEKMELKIYFLRVSARAPEEAISRKLASKYLTPN